MSKKLTLILNTLSFIFWLPITAFFYIGCGLGISEICNKFKLPPIALTVFIVTLIFLVGSIIYKKETNQRFFLVNNIYLLISGAALAIFIFYFRGIISETTYNIIYYGILKGNFNFFGWF